MLHIESPHQGIYAPLSQAMTDSDSEEQLFLRQQQPNPNKRVGNRNPPDSLALNQHPSPLLHFKRQHENHRKFMQQRSNQQQQQQYENIQRQQKFQINAQTSLDTSIIQPSSYTTNMQNTFRSVMMSDCGGEPGSSFSSFNSDYDDRYAADNVAILSNNGETKDTAESQPMSTARRLCFVASLLLCFLVVLSFIWLVPCTEEGTCPAAVDRVKTHNWLSKYTNIELKGGVNVVRGLRSWENNLIFLYRGDSFFPESRPGITKRNGVISLIGSSGAVAWYDEMHDEPVAIDCTLVDIDRNGQADCLVMDEYGELGIINPLSGQWYWKYKERSAHKIDASDFPVILPDMDGDDVFELLVVTSVDLLQRTKVLASRKGDMTGQQSPPRNFLRILSGRMGGPIGEGFQIHECDLLRKLQLDSSTQTITFNCVRNKTESRRSKTLGEVFALITNKSLIGTKIAPTTAADDVSQHHQSVLRRENDAQRNIYSLSGRELVVENRGKCPDNCNVTFILSDGRNGKVKILRNFTQVGMYGMPPVQWHFKKAKPEMSGFVMKFWKWRKQEPGTTNSTSNSPYVSLKNKTKYNEDLNFAETAPMKPTTNKKSPKSTMNNQKDNTTKPLKIGPQEAQHNYSTNKTYNNGQWNRVHLDHLIQKRESYSLLGAIPITSMPSVNSTKRKAPKNTTHSLHLNNYKMEMITETVILVLFIGADTRIENTSQSNILQFCRNDNNGLVCQPDLNNQENSILIADLDQDSLQELVSFTSTFTESPDTSDYKLVTYVRLLRLQEELPALYSKGKDN